MNYFYFKKETDAHIIYNYLWHRLFTFFRVNVNLSYLQLFTLQVKPHSEFASGSDLNQYIFWSNFLWNEIIVVYRIWQVKEQLD